MTERTAEEIYGFIDKFSDLYDEAGAPLHTPDDDDIVTFYCDNGGDEVGFIEDAAWREGGIHRFIATKWILQSELDELLNEAKK